MPISKKQLIANRKNAQKSTGPKTPFGKFRSSRNAYKHGFYSKFNFEATVKNLPPHLRSRFVKAVLKRLDSPERDLARERAETLSSIDRFTNKPHPPLKRKRSK